MSSIDFESSLFMAALRFFLVLDQLVVRGAGSKLRRCQGNAPDLPCDASKECEVMRKDQWDQKQLPAMLQKKARHCGGVSEKED